MTEQAPVYQTIPADELPPAEALPSLPRRVTPAEGADMLVVYLTHKRVFVFPPLGRQVKHGTRRRDDN